MVEIYYGASWVEFGWLIIAPAESGRNVIRKSLENERGIPDL